jgi:tRNA (adenine22-N1)-methyltransferase
MADPEIPRCPDRLGARLEAVCELVPVGSRVADIGTDHGKLALSLLRRGRAIRCIATELHPRGAEHLLEMGREKSLPSGLSVRIGDGLTPLRSEDGVDVVVIAGMGGRTIVRVLERGLSLIEPCLVVLQPQSEHGRVRRWLRDHSWRLAEERLIAEGDHTYLVLAARRGATRQWTPFDGLDEHDILEAGPLLVRRRDRLAAEWWRARLDRLSAVVAKLPRGRGTAARVDLQRADRVLRALRRARSPTSLL